jgi:hypothetical protein
MPTERDQLELVFRADTSGVTQADSALKTHVQQMDKVSAAHKQAARAADDATKTFVAATNGIAEKTANAARNTVIFGTRAAQDALQGGLGAIANNIEQVGATVASTFADGFTKGLAALRTAIMGPAGVIALLTLVAVKGADIMAGLGKIADKLGIKPRNGVAEAMEDIKRRTQEAEDAVKSSVDRMRQAMATDEGQESAGQIQQFFAWSNQQDSQAMGKLLEDMRKQAIEATPQVTGARGVVEATEAELARLQRLWADPSSDASTKAAAAHDQRIEQQKLATARAKLAEARASDDVRKAAEADVGNLISGADTAEEQARLLAMVGRAGRPDIVNSLQARSIQAVQDTRRFEADRQQREDEAERQKKAEADRQDELARQRRRSAETAAATREEDLVSIRNEEERQAAVKDQERQAKQAQDEDERAKRDAIRGLEAQRRDAIITAQNLENPAYVQNLLNQGHSMQELQAAYERAIGTYAQTTELLMQATGHALRRIEDLERAGANMYNIARQDIRSKLGRGF